MHYAAAAAPAAAKSLQSRPTLYNPTEHCAKWLQLCLKVCDPMDCSPPGSSVHGVLQGRILEWGCHGLLHSVFPGIKPVSLMSPALAGGFFTTSATWEAPFIPPHYY